VIVVGEGPTGLLLAGDLAEAGVCVSVLDRRDAGVSNLSRAFVVHARTLELLDERGLTEPLRRSGAAEIDHLRLFGAISLDLSDLPSRFPFILVTPQYRLEEHLRARALRAGARLLRGVTVTGVRQDAGGVEAIAVDSGGSVGAEGAEVSIRARYLVGADGIRSAVRSAVGIGYPGRSVLRSIMLADVHLREHPDPGLGLRGTGDAFSVVAPFGDGWYRVFAWDRANELPDTAPVELEEIASVLRRTLGSDLGIQDPRWMSRFHSDERLATRYREGRVFLAGDAAHCHSPAGGQGMNTGLQDAADLSGRLVAVLRGAPETLLDGYQKGRRPAGRRAVRTSGTLVRLATVRAPAARRLRDSVLPRLLRVRPVSRRIMARVTGTG
jgi:2-polyprenyl-6-methoxyphenol hydroxylase-like FAD-dependent oxidoreductase